MIVRAQTPKGLSWAGRLAVLGTAALLLPLAPSWGQKTEADSIPRAWIDRQIPRFPMTWSSRCRDRDQSVPGPRKAGSYAQHPKMTQGPGRREER